MGQSSLRAQRKRSLDQEKAENRKEYFSKCFSSPLSSPSPVSLWPTPITEQQGQPQDYLQSAHLPKRRTPARSRTASRRTSPGRSPPSTGWPTTSTSSASPWSQRFARKQLLPSLMPRFLGLARWMH